MQGVDGRWRARSESLRRRNFFIFNKNDQILWSQAGNQTFHEKFTTRMEPEENHPLQCGTTVPIQGPSFPKSS